MLPHDKSVSEIIRPNAEDFDGEYWDPWDALNLGCCSYNSAIDQGAIDVLRGIQEGLFNSDIAKRTGMSEAHVEMFQGIFSSADWCEYGTSPRGCWPIDRNGFPALIAAWETYFLRHWKEPASGIEARQRQDATRLDPKDESPIPEGETPTPSSGEQ